jgi:hypothetical protein
MAQKDYTATISANITPKEALVKISSVSDWWTRSFKGQAQKPGDTFTVRFGETFVDFKVIEVISEKKVVWQVSACNLHWIKNKTEWTNTQVVRDVSPEDRATRVRMTHVGLVPEVECYDSCKKGWNFYVGESLLKLLTQNKGLPDEQGKKQSA